MSYGNENKTFEALVRYNGYPLERTNTDQFTDLATQLVKIGVRVLAIAGIAAIAHVMTRPELSEGTLQLPTSVTTDGTQNFSNVSISTSPTSQIFEDKK